MYNVDSKNEYTTERRWGAVGRYYMYRGQNIIFLMIFEICMYVHVHSLYSILKHGRCMTKGRDNGKNTKMERGTGGITCTRGPPSVVVCEKL